MDPCEKNILETFLQKKNSLKLFLSQNYQMRKIVSFFIL